LDYGVYNEKAKMTNFQFLQKYVRLQQDIMFDEVVNLEYASVGISKNDKSGYWNNALVNKILSEVEITKIEEILTSRDRKPTIYFENREDLKPLSEMLALRKYTKKWKDSWQFWNGGKIDTRYFDSVVEVATPLQLSIFLKVFNECYQKNDPQNPYGELGDYLKVAEDVWHKHNKTKRLEYFMVFKNKKPVAVSTLANFEGIGYISNVGSLREVRGQGYGKTATLYCVGQSIRYGNTEHCLATEEGAYPNEFYKRIGFATRFTALGYTKK
jgi:hypothetical protein